MVKVAIKFCGGCNPTFDRVEYWDCIQRSAGERVRWVRLGEDSCEAALLVCGCQRACLEHLLPTLTRAISLRSNEMAPDDVVRALIEKENSHEDRNKG